MIDARSLSTRIEKALPGAEVEALDVQGGDHFEVTVVSDLFENVTLVARHRMIYAALGDAMRGDVHALTIRALTPREAERERDELIEVQRS